ncbi:MAG: substrate-binding domain-containing protein, partial [Anaerolineae bacterium]|nr:substrate-binding domain-containing protein [Anaerolineae bacterium]
MRRFLVFGLIIVALVLAACGGAETEPTAAVEPTAAAEPAVAPEPTAAPEPTKDSMPAMGEATVMDGKIMLPEVNPLEVTGDVIAAGSSTVFPLAEVLAERFIDEGYGGNITIDSIGSGAGFERFCVAGETDISDASRPIKDSEIESCGKLSPARTPIEFRVGTDALAVVVNPDNDWVGEEGLTLEELAKLFSVDTINWSDVNPDWPAEP